MKRKDPLSAMEHYVEVTLKSMQLSFIPHASVMGLRLDFLVTLPGGQLIVVEVKGPSTLPTAVRQMELLINAVDAVGGVIAVPDSIQPVDQPTANIRVVGISDLSSAISGLAHLHDPDVSID
jgi:hypothetical protein